MIGLNGLKSLDKMALSGDVENCDVENSNTREEEDIKGEQKEEKGKCVDKLREKEKRREKRREERKKRENCCDCKSFITKGEISDLGLENKLED